MRVLEIYYQRVIYHSLSMKCAKSVKLPEAKSTRKLARTNISETASNVEMHHRPKYPVCLTACLCLSHVGGQPILADVTLTLSVTLRVSLGS